MPRIGEDVVYVGVDPGASGGLAAICNGYVEVVDMPETERDVWQWINGKSWIFGDRSFACVEQVSGFVGGGGQPGSAMFKFGQSYGMLRAFLIACHIPFDQVTPQRWQKALGCGNRARGESKTDWKRRLKAKAQQLFPEASVTQANADALLIAEYCRRLKTGRL